MERLNDGLPTPSQMLPHVRGEKGDGHRMSFELSGSLHMDPRDNESNDGGVSAHRCGMMANSTSPSPSALLRCRKPPNQPCLKAEREMPTHHVDEETALTASVVLFKQRCQDLKQSAWL